MTTETFVFSQLNFNGDENQRRKRKRSRAKKEINPSGNTCEIGLPKNRPITMSLFASSDSICRPSFDPSKYILTPKGYINYTIFPKATSPHLTDVHYITGFPQLLINDALVIFTECESVLHFVLDQIIQLPCHVPIRWGVLFNLKFRRVFQCLTLEKWAGLFQVLKKHDYARLVKGSVHLNDPACDSPIEFDEHVSLFDCLEPDLNLDLGLLKTPLNTTNLFNHRNQEFRPSPSKSLSLQSTPVELSLDSPANVPVQRAKNNSIYAIHLSHSISPALADRFDPSTFPPLLRYKINQIYNHCDTTVAAITNHLKQLPVGIPLRWGVIYNKHLRVRSRREAGTSLDQWKQLKSLLIDDGYLCDKTVANCAILKNKTI